MAAVVSKRVQVALTQAEIVERRSNRLARGLRRLGVGRGATVSVYVDDVEGIDAQVAVRAAEKLASTCVLVTVPEQDHAARELARSLASTDPDVILASERGVRSLLSATVRALIVGDGGGVRWWRIIEARERADDLTLAELA